MPTINRLEPFTAMADIYQAAGFAARGVEIAQKLIELVFDTGWTGRTILDLGCGTGDMAVWFAEKRFRVRAIDSSSFMVRRTQAIAEQQNLDINASVEDIRTYKPEITYDMVTCFGTLNYMVSLRDVESLFRVAHAATTPGKMFAFDMRTIQGLALAAHTEKVLFDNDENIFITARNNFNYEQLMLTTQYTLMIHDGKAGWQRAEETHHQRGYPVQSVTKLLAQIGFRLLRTLTPNFESADPADETDSLIFVATREG